VFAAQFIFKPGVYDERFHELDASIDAFALTLDGFLGVERWQSADGTVKNSIYYFVDMETVKVFSRFEDHKTAKAEYAKWYEGYQVVISEVTATYGDGNIPSIAAANKR
jgi:heme-degrading monooxygenase HmoA